MTLRRVRIITLCGCALFLAAACSGSPGAAAPCTSSPGATSAATCATAIPSPTRHAFAGPKHTLTAIAGAWPTSTPLEPYQIIRSGKPHFIEFHARWCSACNAMLPAVLRLQQQYQDRVDFHILNVDSDANRALVHKYKAYGIPLTVLLDAEGYLVKSLAGQRDEAALAAAIEWLLAPPACPTVTPPPPPCDAC
ncbi:MAG: redoxin domain-containing protein [Anaerolineae bacterium]|nr:redoxin domain-containing protein [Anaerolineae bacterium]